VTQPYSQIRHAFVLLSSAVAMVVGSAFLVVKYCGVFNKGNDRERRSKQPL
jgi:hypothetical protein